MTSSRAHENYGERKNAYENTRLSLFDINLEKARAMNKKHLIHRVIFAAKIKSTVTERREIGGGYERLFKQLHSQIQGETFTGLLLIYPSHVVHIVETSTDILQEVIRHLENSERNGNALVYKTRILVYAHDISARLFTQWSFRVLNIPTSRIESYDSTQSYEAVVTEAITVLLKLGHHLAQIPKVNLKVEMDQLYEKVPDLLPPQDMLEYMCECNDICTPSEYIHHYGKPFATVLDSELVWPIPSYLMPQS
ncbi:testis-expressed protein 47-like isoform X2 [Xenia sp. Carnegie-2017]|uniref:testis-expressed protein 47-like isoform X2 n=1 Tax=Xenia sp. Carnegie-2017 TaxID=2897299 RepID=UPI001F03912D|nr:testis-expressed protein 47-like isoform X2 [Xenia sp. Carnegie-2017]